MEEKIMDDVLIQILSYLKVADVRSCRQVCRRWYLCCNKRKITRAEKFVFRSTIDLPFEINEFLLNLERRVNVKLIRLDLRELNFELFGSNIEELELKDCIVDVYTLRNIFRATPNMRRLHWISYEMLPEWFDVIISGLEVWRTTIYLLHGEEFQNFNMKEFKCNIKDIETVDSLGFRFSHFLFMFPRIQSISLCQEFHFKDIADLMNVLPKTNITHLGGFLHMPFDSIDESETFTSFSRLKILKVNICSVRSSSYLSLCKRFFSQMTELEELTCLFFIDVPVYAAQTSRFADPGNVAKVVLFHILRSCPKLTKISFSMDYGTQIRLNRDELQEFFCLIRKIKKLKLPRIVAESNSEKPMVTQANNTDDLLKDLGFFVAEFHEPSDIHFIIMETYQLTSLSLLIVEECSCMNVEKILQSQKYLQRLNVTISMDCLLSEMEVLLMNLNIVIPLKHERLNHLAYVFDLPRPSDPIDYFIKRICSFEFPNLRTLKVSSGCHEYRPSFKTTTPELKILFKTWLGNMTTLNQIDVELHSDLLDVHDCLEVCGQMPYLQKIRWTTPDIKEYDPQNEVVNLFAHLPNLRSMFCGYENCWGEGDTYKYSRCLKELFRRSFSETSESYDFISVN